MYKGSFMGWPTQIPCSANLWQNYGFTWAVWWVGQNEPNVIPMCVKTVALDGQFHGSITVNHIKCECQYLHRLQYKHICVGIILSQMPTTVSYTYRGLTHLTCFRWLLCSMNAITLQDPVSSYLPSLATALCLGWPLWSPVMWVFREAHT